MCHPFPRPQLRYICPAFLWCWSYTQHWDVWWTAVSNILNLASKKPFLSGCRSLQIPIVASKALQDIAVERIIPHLLSPAAASLIASLYFFVKRPQHVYAACFSAFTVHLRVLILEFSQKWTAGSTLHWLVFWHLCYYRHLIHCHLSV